jgi:hypothetical protein
LPESSNGRAQFLHGAKHTTVPANKSTGEWVDVR